MATWTDIPDSVLEPGKPIRSVDALALRDNAIAIAQGAAGAPRVAAAALRTGNPERDWVLARTAGATAGAVGTYAFVRRASGSGSTSWGQTISGSSLLRASVVAESSIIVTASGSLTGTWRIMGQTISQNAATLAVRIS